jgi:hypothetical protein
MGYTASQTEPLAQRLVANLPGLNINLARSWIGAESGGNNNPLGVTATLGSGQPIGQMISAKTYLVKYPTPTAGIDAASALLKSPSMSWAYGGVVKAINGGTTAQQASALIASPWNVTNSPYYRRVFTAAGLLSNTTKTTPTPTKTPTTTPGSSGGTGGNVGSDAYPPVAKAVTLTTDQWNAVIASLTPGTRYISASNAQDIINAARKQGLTLTVADLTPFYGKSVSSLRDSLAAKGTIPAADPSGGAITAIGNTVSGLAFWSNPTRLLYIVGGMLMIVAGGFIMLRSNGVVPKVVPVA